LRNSRAARAGRGAGAGGKAGVAGEVHRRTTDGAGAHSSLPHDQRRSAANRPARNRRPVLSSARRDFEDDPAPAAAAFAVFVDALFVVSRQGNLAMPGLLPHRFLFRYQLPVRYDRKLPKGGKKLLGLAPEFALADFSALDTMTPFGELRLAWNEQGLGI